MSSDTQCLMGWDIGGVHVKAVRTRWKTDQIDPLQIVQRPCEMWHEFEHLTETLCTISEEMGLDAVQAMAVTMTAELCDAFRLKREGVRFVLKAVTEAFPCHPVYFLDTRGQFVQSDADFDPLDLAATNWLASAGYLAAKRSDFILMDVGSTTTDIIPVRGGQIATGGRTDTERLARGELVYTGTLRSNPDTIAGQVPFQGRMCRTAAEYFTNMGDVYRILDLLSEAGYSCPTPDGRAKTVAAARERLARLVCADTEILDPEQVLKIARYLHEKHLQMVSEALLQVLSVQPGGYDLPLIAAGSGAFLAVEIGQRLGLTVVDLEREIGAEAAAVFPALAVAGLAAAHLERHSA